MSKTAIHKIFRRFIGLTLFIFAGVGCIFSQQIDKPGYYFNFMPVDGVKYYEIQLVTEKGHSLLEELANEQERDRVIELETAFLSEQKVMPIEKAPVFLEKNKDYTHLRIRSVDDNDMPGTWGEVFSLSTFYLEPQEKAEPVKKVDNFKEVVHKTVKNEDRKFLYLLPEYFQIAEKPEHIYLYQLNGSEVGFVEQARIPVKTEGEYHLVVFEANKDQNNVQKTEYFFRVDRQAPEVEVLFLPPFFYNRQQKLQINEKTIIEMYAQDNMSGVEKIEYRFLCENSSEEKKFIEYSEPFSAQPDECKAPVFEYRAADYSENKSEIHRVKFEWLQDPETEK